MHYVPLGRRQGELKEWLHSGRFIQNMFIIFDGLTCKYNSAHLSSRGVAILQKLATHQKKFSKPHLYICVERGTVRATTECTTCTMECLIIGLLCKQSPPALSLKVDDSNHTGRHLALNWVSDVWKRLREGNKNPEREERRIGRYPHDWTRWWNMKSKARWHLTGKEPAGMIN